MIERATSNFLKTMKGKTSTKGVQENLQTLCLGCSFSEDKVNVKNVKDELWQQPPRFTFKENVFTFCLGRCTAELPPVENKAFSPNCVSAQSPMANVKDNFIHLSHCNAEMSPPCTSHQHCWSSSAATEHSSVQYVHQNIAQQQQQQKQELYKLCTEEISAAELCEANLAFLSPLHPPPSHAAGIIEAMRCSCTMFCVR